MPRAMTSRVLVFFIGIATLVAAPAAAQQLTGDISGNVQDAQGGLLPGVTVNVNGPALIGGPQATVTNDGGSYQVTGLPPGMYVLTFELSGFAILQRDGVRVQVAQSTRVDVAMSVGSVQETITVSGATPLVDVRNTTTQTNIDKEFFDAVPTSRNPWTMAGLVPGVVTATLDVGGTLMARSERRRVRTDVEHPRHGRSDYVLCFARRSAIRSRGREPS